MAKRQARGTAPRSSETIRRTGGIPFLRPEDTTDGEVLRLTGFNNIRDRDSDREQIVCEVENQRGENFNMGIRIGSPDHNRLHRAMGADWRRWDGSVIVTIAPGTRGGSFVNVKSASRENPEWYAGDTSFDDVPPPSDRDR